MRAPEEGPGPSEDLRENSCFPLILTDDIHALQRHASIFLRDKAVRLLLGVFSFFFY